MKFYVASLEKVGDQWIAAETEENPYIHSFPGYQKWMRESGMPVQQTFELDGLIPNQRGRVYCQDGYRDEDGMKHRFYEMVWISEE